MDAVGVAAQLGDPAGSDRCRDIFPLPPLLPSTFPCTSKSSRVRGRVRRLQRAHELATSAIDALNSLYAAPTASGRGGPPAATPNSSRVAEVHQYIFDCCFEFAATPESPDESALQVDPLREDKDEAYDDFGSGGAIDLLSELVALPAEGGLFPVADYVGPELAAYAFAEPPACDD